MVAYDKDDFVRGLYTNQDLIASSTSVTLGSSKELVQDQLGTPKTFIPYSTFNYHLNSNGEYDVYLHNNSYITVFYDKHENDTVTAIKVIDEELKKDNNAIYVDPSQELQEGFEFQLFDLTNATRKNHGLPILTWDDR